MSHAVVRPILASISSVLSIQRPSADRRCASRRATAVAGVVAAAGLSGFAAAQCSDPTWLPGDGCPGTNLYVAATTLWDADGPGPGTAKLVVAGRFDIAGNVTANNIALYDPADGSWSALGAGLGLVGDLSTVYAVVTMPDGSLVAGGDFLDADGQPASHIARWDGTSWSSLGAGMDFGTPGVSVSALAVLPDGSLVAGGDFLIAGETFSPRIARWDGREWSAMGIGADSSTGFATIAALAVSPSGDLYAGGDFELMDGVEATNLARWDGTTWSSVGGGTNLALRAITVLPNGDVAVGGNFTQAGGNPAKRIAIWNGATWSVPGGGVTDGIVYTLSVSVTGDLIVGGTLESVGGLPVSAIARWSGGAWSALGSGLAAPGSSPIAFSITPMSDGDLFVGGQFESAGDSNASNIARWSDDKRPAAGWSALATGFNGAWIDTLTILSNGDVLAGGDFSSAGDGMNRRLARWNGSSWGAFASEENQLQPGGFVEEIVERDDGAILIGGAFLLPGDENFDSIALWNGTAWDDLGAECDGYVRAMAFRPDGTMLVGGAFSTIGGLRTRSLAFFDGTNWSVSGSGLDEFGEILAAVTMPNGDVIVGGSFVSIDDVSLNYLARWDDTSWHSVGDGTDQPVYELAVDAAGNLIATGAFTFAGSTPASGIARWTGRTWEALGSGINDGAGFALVVESDGDVVVGGQFTHVGDVGAINIARWDGNEWHALGASLTGPTDESYSVVYGLATRANGELLAGGQFLRSGDVTMLNFARYGCESLCPSDLDGSGDVGASDLAILLGQWGTAGSADFDGNGSVGSSDLAILLGDWGSCG